jgi:hypothetical protein
MSSPPTWLIEVMVPPVLIRATFGFVFRLVLHWLGTGRRSGSASLLCVHRPEATLYLIGLLLLQNSIRGAIQMSSSFSPVDLWRRTPGAPAEISCH